MTRRDDGIATHHLLLLLLFQFKPASGMLLSTVVRETTATGQFWFNIVLIPVYTLYILTQCLWVSLLSSPAGLYDELTWLDPAACQKFIKNWLCKNKPLVILRTCKLQAMCIILWTLLCSSSNPTTTMQRCSQVVVDEQSRWLSSPPCSDIIIFVLRNK